MTESVWDYPRPPRLERSTRLVEVLLAGAVIASTTHAHRVLETSHPPVYYIPRGDILDVIAPDGRRIARGAWTYETPTARFAPITDAVAFYPALMEACTVDGEVVRPQPGGFYGGWVTDDLVGPFKGAPGTMGW
jgi:uncharacterized protein (DUF427 family)